MADVRNPSSRAPKGRGASPLGELLRHWRRARGLSQLDLALRAEVSPRHMSFVETGRTRPSREMVLLLARALDVPLRERNAFLLAAGFAPMYLETGLDAPELAGVRAAIDAILAQQEPFPAVVMNRYWDVLSTNAAAERFFQRLLRDATEPAPTNVLHLMFDPAAVRPHVANWHAVAESLIQRVHREVVGGVCDERTRELLESLLAYPNVPASWRQLSVEAPLVPVVPVEFLLDGSTFRYFSTVTTLGTPQDITLQEIRIECFFPFDEGTRRSAQELR